MIRLDPDGFSEDLFASTRMSFGDHLEDLRLHLWRAIAGFAAILGACLLLDAIGYATDTGIGVGRPVMGWIAYPVEQQLQRLYERRKERMLKAAQASEETREIELDLNI